MKVFQHFARFFSATAILPLIVLARTGFFFNTEQPFHTIGCFLSLFPGTIGSHLRVAYYRCTLREMGPDCHIGFGSFFSRKDAVVGRNISIGAYCIIGKATIGDGVLMASRVSVISGKHQHGTRQDAGKLSGDALFSRVRIGANSWIGEGAVVAADIGKECIVGFGSIVTASVPDRSVVAGNPAKPIVSTPLSARS